MKLLLLGAVGLSFAYVLYQAWLGNAASTQLIGAYVAASLAALAFAAKCPELAAKVKWSWVALSLVVIWSIITGPLDMLRLPV